MQGNLETTDPASTVCRHGWVLWPAWINLILRTFAHLRD